jgi:hypothetical protein
MHAEGEVNYPAYASPRYSLQTRLLLKKENIVEERAHVKEKKWPVPSVDRWLSSLTFSECTRRGRVV